MSSNIDQSTYTFWNSAVRIFPALENATLQKGVFAAVTGAALYALSSSTARECALSSLKGICTVVKNSLIRRWDHLFSSNAISQPVADTLKKSALYDDPMPENLSSPFTSPLSFLHSFSLAPQKETLSSGVETAEELFCKDKLPSKWNPLATAPITPLVFTLGLTHVFKDTVFDKGDYPSSMQAYRKAVAESLATSSNLTPELSEIGYKVMTQPLFISGSNVLQQKLSNSNKAPLHKLLFLDREKISNEKDEHEGIARRSMNKVRAKANWCDLHLNGNLPFLIGTRKLENKTVQILRHPVPTIEDRTIHIGEEYLAFLEYCKSKNEKVLYCSLLNPAVSDEAARIDAISDLGVEYKNTFHFIRFPLDGPLSRAAKDPSTSLKDYKTLLEKDICQSILNPSSRKGSFLLTHDVSASARKSYPDILDFAYEKVSTVALDSDYTLEKSKQTLLMLFCTLLKNKILTDLNVDYYNNTCKDAIDRGGAHLICDLALDFFLRESLDSHVLDIQTITAFPPYMAKTQAILKERLGWACSLLEFFNKTDPAFLKKGMGPNGPDMKGRRSISFDDRRTALEGYSDGTIRTFFSSLDESSYDSSISSLEENTQPENLELLLAIPQEDKELKPSLENSLTKEYPQKILSQIAKTHPGVTVVFDSNFPLPAVSLEETEDAFSSQFKTTFLAKNTHTGEVIRRIQITTKLHIDKAATLNRDSIPVSMVFEASTETPSAPSESRDNS